MQQPPRLICSAPAASDLRQLVPRGGEPGRAVDALLDDHALGVQGLRLVKVAGHPGQIAEAIQALRAAPGWRSMRRTELVAGSVQIACQKGIG